MLVTPARSRSGLIVLFHTSSDISFSSAFPYMVEYFQNQVTDPFILEVRRERGIELTMENSRYQERKLVPRFGSAVDEKDFERRLVVGVRRDDAVVDAVAVE